MFNYSKFTGSANVESSLFVCKYARPKLQELARVNLLICQYSKNRKKIKVMFKLIKFYLSLCAQIIKSRAFNKFI